MSIIDFHSHILPGIDDGARNLDTSMAMLEQIREQKVDYMVATPHFYASKDRIDSFLAKRANAWEQLSEAIEERQFHNAPQFFLGSEVAFFEGISRADQIDSLTIGDTNLLLLEMPFVPWTMQNVREVEKLMDDTVHTAEDMEKYFDLVPLTTIPESDRVINFEGEERHSSKKRRKKK